jgi:hypothetical protein
MLISIFRCPSCNVLLRPGQPLPSGKHVKCWECGTHFAVPNENAHLPQAPVAVPRQAVQPRLARDLDPETQSEYLRPRRRQRSRQAKQTKSWLALLVIATGVLFVGLIVVLVVWLAGGGYTGLQGKPAKAKPNPEVTRANYDRLHAGMDIVDVEQLLGPGERINLRDLPDDDAYTIRSIRAHAEEYRASKFYRWRNGPSEIYVGVGVTPKRNEVVVLHAYYFEIASRGPGSRARELDGRAAGESE